MSSEWTPMERYMHDREMVENGFGHFYELEYENDDVNKMHRELEALSGDYPYLAVAFACGIISAAQTFSPEIIALLEAHVKELCLCVDRGEDISHAKVDDFVKAWFAGELDEDSAENDYMLCYWLMQRDPSFEE